MHPHRHATPRAGWLNDPHGITFRDGTYHLFFQHVPGSLEWRPDVHWGHLTSPDLVTWTEHPVALAPGADETGCWTGCLQVATSTAEARILYTSVSEPNLDLGHIREATPVSADWRRWRPGEVVVRAPQDVELKIFRDPAISVTDQGQRMVVGAGFADGSPAVLSFTSPDGVAWSYEGVLARSAPGTGDGFAWECPQLVHLDGATVLIVSACRTSGDNQVLASVGAVTNGAWQGTAWRQLSFGQGHYAATVFTDAEGNPCLMFWIRGITDPDGQWVGALSVPYRLSVDGGMLRLAPHPVVDTAFQPVEETSLPEELGLNHRRWRVFRDGPVLEWCSGTELIGLPSDGVDYSSSGR